MKIKQESSGPPEGIDLDLYIAEYLENEGILLDKDKIELNPALRLIAKLQLNSSWGKLGQRRNQEKNVTVYDAISLHSLIDDPKIQIQSILWIDAATHLVSYILADDSDVHEGCTSLAIAAFVTSYGRLKLYDLMQQVESVREGRLAYVDTDSIIYVHREGDPKVETGLYLGELTDELGANEICNAAIFFGAKSYIMVIKNSIDPSKNHQIVKMKGLTLNEQYSLNFDRLFEFYQRTLIDHNAELYLGQNLFRARRNEQIVRSLEIKKKLRMTADKRMLLCDGQTLPYGYLNN